MATLRDILHRLAEFDDELTLYAAKPWTADSPAIATLEPESGAVPTEAAGMDYLLEISLAKSVLDVWKDWRHGREPSDEERCEAIIYYAEHDAYLPT
jgi:hypothetical protein